MSKEALAGYLIDILRSFLKSSLLDTGSVTYRYRPFILSIHLLLIRCPLDLELSGVP
ncbi:hypothetical protein [Dickeya phage Mysterion]|uniref:Uncharacterized protein n=1 Tax=Dickeya phage Mysterion TaxID=2320193 RepID=A0A385IGJ7_9CAUD|nr:hypothetical protein HOU15_gp52 [Dickeya phage Mysterion]AXY81985.1 hypothetical protein [Dickeya phage Mysterion]